MTQQFDITTCELPAPFLAVTFRVGDQTYGLPIESVREIVDVPALLPVGGAPPYLRGMINLRGVFLLVLDARTLVSGPAPIALSNQVMILGGARPEFGLLVDRALTVDRVTPLPSIMLPHYARLPLFDHVLSSGEYAAYHVDLDGLRALLPASPNETV